MNTPPVPVNMRPPLIASSSGSQNDQNTERVASRDETNVPASALAGSYRPITVRNIAGCVATKTRPGTAHSASVPMTMR